MGRRARLLQLQQRRQQLLLRLQVQRAELAVASADVALRLRWLDLAWHAAGVVRQRPWLLAVPAIAWALLGQRRLARMAAIAPLLLRLAAHGGWRPGRP